MYLFFRDLAIILIAAKFFGLIALYLKAPQVVGQIIAGLLIGPSVCWWLFCSEIASRSLRKWALFC